MEPRKLVRVEWVIERTGLHRRVVYRHAQFGRIPCVKVGRTVLFDPEAVERWIRAGGHREDDLGDAG